MLINTRLYLLYIIVGSIPFYFLERKILGYFGMPKDGNKLYPRIFKATIIRCLCMSMVFTLDYELLCSFFMARNFVFCSDIWLIDTEPRLWRRVVLTLGFIFSRIILVYLAQPPFTGKEVMTIWAYLRVSMGQNILLYP